MTTRSFEDLVDDFTFLDDWEDRYQYIIDLGKDLQPLPESEKTETTRVEGCMSQVWMLSESDGARPPHLTFRADSDALIVRGLIAVLLRLFDGKTPEEILGTDTAAALARLDLETHISPNRRNGFASMIRRIRATAEATLAAS